MISKCYNLIPKKLISGIYKNLEIIDSTYYPEYDQYCDFDFNKLDRYFNFLLTESETVLSNKLIQIREEIASIKREKERENQMSFKILNFDIFSINKNIKMIYLIAVFAILIFSVLFTLKKLEKRERAKNKNKRN
jgi:hypothetical protein